MIMQMGAQFMSMAEWVWGNFHGFCAGPRLQVCTPFQLALLQQGCMTVVLWTYTHS